jgi:hypothetical protein
MFAEFYPAIYGWTNFRKDKYYISTIRSYKSYHNYYIESINYCQ